MESWIVLIFIVIGCVAAIYYAYITKDQGKKLKLLMKARIGVLLLAAMMIFLCFSNSSKYAYYIDTDVERKITTIEDAARELQYTNETLQRFVDDVRRQDTYLLIAVFILASLIIPAIFRLTESSVTGIPIPEDEKEKEVISIFDEENK